MAQHDVLLLNETVSPSQIQEVQAGDTYRLPADVEIVGDLAISGTVDGRDVAADGALAASALQPDGSTPLSNNWDVGAFKITALSMAIGSYLDLTPIAGPTHVEGRVFYDSQEKALSYYTEEEDVTMNVGQEMWLRVFNDSGGLIENGKVVRIIGSTGTNAKITKVIATSNTPRVLGITTHSIEDQTYGYVTTFGMVRDVDLSAFNDGDSIYLSRDTAGELVITPSDAPSETLEVGIAVDASVSGQLLVDVENNRNLFPIGKSYTFSARVAASGEYFLGGFYNYAVAESNLSNGSPTQTHGSANGAHGGHAFMVFGAGTTNGTTITVTISGTSITDAGVRTPADSEILFTGDPATLTLDDYLETTLKWIGQITYTLTSDGGTFTCDLNYGLAKYDDFSNHNYTVHSFEMSGLTDATDTGFNVQLLHHESEGWTYHASAFVAGAAHVLADMNAVYSTEQNVTGGDPFAFNLSSIDHAITGNNGEGVLIRVTTSVNNSIAYINAHIDATIP